MKRPSVLSLIIWMGIAFWGCQQSPPEPGYSEPVPPEASSYPFTHLDLTSESLPDGWMLADAPTLQTADGQLHAEDGRLTLLKKADASATPRFQTSLVHEDLDLSFDFMLGGGADLSLILKGVHEVPIVGGESPPSSLRANGLWQNIQLSFRTANDVESQDLLTELWLNGVKLYSDLRFGEGAGSSGALEFDVKQGSIALRNIGIKAYQDKSLQLDNIQYAYYPVETSNQVIDKVADFDLSKLEAKQTGAVDTISRHLSPERANFILDFNAELDIEEAGLYGFYIQVGGGALLYIDEQLVVDADGERSYTDDKAYGQLELSKGKHQFRLAYLQNHRWWRRGLGIWAEGPGLMRQPLHAPGSILVMEEQKALAVMVSDETELLRSFMMHQEKKRTHVLSVGSPEGLAYAYDLNEGSLLKIWNGAFLDVREMWVERGEPQLAHPMGNIIDLAGKSGFLREVANPWPDSAALIRPRGYQLDENGYPQFRFDFQEGEILDAFVPADDQRGWQRNVEWKGQGKIYVFAAGGGRIRSLGEGRFAINDMEFLMHFPSAAQPIIQNSRDGGHEMYVPLTAGQSLTYSIHW